MLKYVKISDKLILNRTNDLEGIDFMGNMADVQRILKEFDGYIGFDICCTSMYQKLKLNLLLEAYEIYRDHLNIIDFVDLCTQLGRIHANLGYEQLAFDYFFHALELVKQTNNNEKLAIIYSYIGYTYQRLGASRDALLYFHKERTCYFMINIDNENLLERVFLLNINIGLAYCAIQNYEMARTYIKIIGERRFFDFTYRYRILINSLRLKTSFGIVDLDRITYYTKQLLNEINLSNHRECFFEFYEIFQLQLKNKNKKALSHLLDAMIEIAKDLNYDNYSFTALSAKLEYYKYKKDSTKYLDALKEFLEHTKQKEELVKELKQVRLLKRNEVLRIEQENKYLKKRLASLKERSEQDELTKLPNRYRLKSYVNEKFLNAMNHSLNFGIDIIDVDFFKQYNDNFGHLNGDKCLVQIAETLRSVAKNHFVARYGGDEFFIIFINQSTDEIKKIANEIQEIISKLNIKQAEGLPYDRVTVSHGIFQMIPKNGSNFDDFIKKADMALSKGKNKSRNAVFFGEISDTKESAL